MPVARYNRRVHDLLASTQSVRIGGGRVQVLPGGGCRLSIPPVARGYADAQLDDTQGLPRDRFCWTPPLRLTIRAQVSPALSLGTYGFGLWNDPFAVSLGQRGAARRLPCGPRALWFFYASPPNEFGFTSGPRSGWRAMSIDTPYVHPLWLTPAALAVAALAQIPIVRRPVMRAALRQVSAAEAVLTSAAGELHEYELIWERSAATFQVDGQVVLRAAAPPRGPLGFVAWIDNQYAIATPESGLRFGTLMTEAEQSLDLRLASIAPLAG
jgi:hypothetical protein